MIDTKGVPTMVGTINTNDLLSSIDLLDAWCWILGFRVELREKFCNPFRNDNNPSAFLDSYGDTILLYDFAASEFHGLHLLRALEYTYPNDPFNKRLQRFYIDYAAKNIRHINRVSYKAKDSFQFFLETKVRNWQQRDADYWSQFQITRSNLESEQVFPIEYFLYNTRKNPSKIIKATPLDIAYTIRAYGKDKVYRPYAKNFKWITNMRQNLIGGNSAFSSKTLWIKKSYKDYQVIINTGRSSRYILSEGIKKLPSSFVKMAIKEFDMIIPLMDNDEAGIKAAKRFEQQIIEEGGNAYGAWVDPMFGSDPAELIHHFGEEILENELQRIENEAYSKLSKTIAL